MFGFHRVSQQSGAEARCARLDSLRTHDMPLSRRILAYFLQTALLLIGSDQSWLAWLGVLNFNLLQSSGAVCVVPLTPMQRLLSGIYMPLLCFGLFAALWGLQFGVWWLCTHSCRPERTQRLSGTWLRCLLPTQAHFNKTPCRALLVL